MIELYEQFIVLRVLPLRISDKLKNDSLRVFSMEHLL